MNVAVNIQPRLWQTKMDQKLFLQEEDAALYRLFHVYRGIQCLDQRRHKSVVTLICQFFMARKWELAVQVYRRIWLHSSVQVGLSLTTPQTPTHGKLLAFHLHQQEHTRDSGNSFPEFIKSLLAAPVSLMLPCAIHPSPPVQKTARWYLGDETWSWICACVQGTRHEVLVSVQ